MVATPSLTAELSQRGFSNLGMWTRGVDTELFSPDRAIKLDLPRPIFISVGRIAVEKNLEAFLSLDLPGTKVVIGTGPQEAELRQRFPDAKFLGRWKTASCPDISPPPTSSCSQAGPIRSAWCSSKRSPPAFRSRPFPVTGPKDVIGTNPIGALNEDLRVACLDALKMSRQACRDYALAHSWENSARQFVGNIKQNRAGTPTNVAAAFGRHGDGERLVRRRGFRSRSNAGKARQIMTSLTHAELPKDMVTKAYARWAPVYDVVFGAVFDRGRHAAIDAAERIGGRILEVGVGTGISLPD